MANCISFPEANSDLRGGDTGAMDIRVWRDGTRVIECWMFDPQEIAQINETGKFWVTIHTTVIPPLSISGTTPFVHGDAATEELVKQEKFTALKNIQTKLHALGPEWFQGDSIFAQTLRELREEASHA